MKKILTFTFSLFAAFSLTAQEVPNFWKQIGYDQVFLPEKAETVTFPPEYKVYVLDLDDMVSYLREAPEEGSAEALAGDFQILLPQADGTFERFAAWKSAVMHPDLAAKYPTIKTFAGRSLDRPGNVTRFGYSLAGFHSIIGAGEGGAITEPYATFQNKYYITHAHSNFILEEFGFPDIQFLKEEGQEVTEDLSSIIYDESIDLRGGGEGALAERRDYLFVLACTGEFAEKHGDDIPTVLGVLVSAVNAMNMLLERDIDVRFTMHPNNDQVVFLNKNIDPYINANQGGALLGQNEDVLNQIIGQANFDVGHVYTGGCTDVGGVVSGTVCATGKARGVTCNFTSNVIGITLSIAAHEIMHQFSGGHTFNNCPGQGGQFSSSSAWEPGSGSTILSYQGSCGAQNNVPGPATLQYHAGNIDEVWTYTHFQGGNVCVSVTTTSNHSPVVTENYNDGFSIPLNTPFELEASATDEDGDDLTYSWEQMNRNPSAPVGSPVGDSPTFRVYDHTASPIRYFPRLPTILNNGSDNFEILPGFEKNLNFRCFVRDNNLTEGAGGITWVDVAFKADDTAGPFLVTNPNNSAVSWTAGEQQEITWDVANTDNSIINCKSVNIYISTNGGNTFDHLVLAGTPNDGSEIITVPNIVSNNVRVKIKAADNIFFDLSNSNFEIKAATDPFYSLQLVPEFQRNCAPDMSLVDINMDAFLGYDQPVDLEVINGLPAGAVVEFSNNPVMPGESTTLTFHMDDVTDIGLFEIDVQAVSNGDTTFRKVFLEVVYTDFSAMVLSGPSNGESNLGLQPNFEWTNLPNADLYDFQLSTSPDFHPDNIVIAKTDLVGTSLTPDFALVENTIYYWRILPSNVCGKGDFSLVNSFQTFNTDCTSKASTDVPIPISAIGLPTIESTVTVLESGIISDVNIKNLSGVHDALADLKVSLISPEETEVVLFEEICGNVSTFNLNLNDESPFEIDCPPINGFAYKPENPLSAFDDENTLGNWTLKMEVVNTIGSGGSLQSWTVEFCASVTPGHPYLLENDTIYVKPNDTRVIHNFEFFAADPDNHVADLKINIINETEHGYIAKNGVQLGVGDFFKFTDINSEKITYTNTNPDADYDFFTFTLTDGGGGLLGTPKFNIVITDDAVLDAGEELRDNQMYLYPNPATDQLNIRFSQSIGGDATVLISDVQGRLLGQQTANQQANLLNIDLEGLTDGIYFVTIKTAEAVMTERFIVQH